MIATALAAVLAFAGNAQQSAPIPETFLQASLDAPGYRGDAKLQAACEKSAPGRVLFAGAIDSIGTTLDLVYQSNQPPRSSEQWRTALGGSMGEPFQIGAIACREAKVALGKDLVVRQLNAYIVAAGMVFNLHIATPDDAEGNGYSRAQFEKLVGSFQLCCVRFGKPQSLPRDAREAMHRAFMAWPNWRATLQGELARKPDDASLSFALGELLVVTQSRNADIIAAHAAALVGWEKLRTPSSEQRFAWMLSEQAIGVASIQEKHFEEAVTHLAKAFEICSQMRAPARGEIAYCMAQAYAQSDRANEAVRYLDEAFNTLPFLKDTARGDRAFASIATDKRFMALVGR